MRPNAIALISCLTVGSAVQAYDPPDGGKELKWLHRFVGEWDSEFESPAEPGQPAIKGSGKIKYRMLGANWLFSQSTAEMRGSGFDGILVIGFDAKMRTYVGMSVDSVTDYKWEYEGIVDDSGKRLVLLTNGPSLQAEGETAQFRDVYEFKSNDHISYTGAFKNDEGDWMTHLTGQIRRSK